MKWLYTLIAMLLLSSCASVPINKPNAVPGQITEQRPEQLFEQRSEQLIAQNLVETLIQVLPKDRTTIVIEDSTFNANYWRVLVDAGYAIRVIKYSPESNYDVLTIKKRTSVDKNEYVLSFNEVVLERKYAAGDETTYPVSPMFVTGAGSAYVELNDQKFSASQKDGFVSSVVMTNRKNPDAVAEKPSPTTLERRIADLNQNIQQQEVVTAVDRPWSTLFNRNRPEISQKDDQKTPTVASQISSLNPINRNMFELKQSNYQSLFDDYEDIHSSTIVFDNDSFLLGRENKKRIIELTDIINQKTDIVSIVGCSHGKTGLGIENSVLAISRANRVKEELMMAGVEPDSVLEEACYAKEYEAALGLPKRGVQVKIKRLKL